MPTRITYGIPTGFGSLMMINYDPCENWSVELVEDGPKVTWGGLRVEAAECSRERLTSGKNTFNRVNTLWADKAKYSKLFFFKSLFYKSSQSESEDWMLLRWEIKSIEKLIWAISCLGSRRQLGCSEQNWHLTIWSVATFFVFDLLKKTVLSFMGSVEQLGIIYDGKSIITM